MRKQLPGLVGVFLGLLALCGCAGPTTPFGAVDIFHPSQLQPVDQERMPATTATDPTIKFSPHHQPLHDASTFIITIEDPAGIPDDYRLSLRYNNLDITRSFQAHAESIFLDSERHRLRLTTKQLRLPPGREHAIHVTYRRSLASQSVTAQYLPPSCSVFASGHGLARVPDFDTPDTIVRLINQLANGRNLNPNYIAGLIAQESAFNPQALSFKKALGLTQITSLGELDVVKNNPQWPRYPGLEHMPFALVKLGIFDGAINSQTEWRLNPALSIQGGIAYLAELTDYWNRPERKNQILEQHLDDSPEVLSEVILASYNSGSFRVSQAMDRLGRHWLDDEELNEAKTYVHRVVSHCDHFENQGDE
jgi:hypothetical protein